MYFFLVGILTLLGLGIRAWQIGHGLPHIFYTDEGLVVYSALNMGGGDLNPHRFHQPSFFYYILLVVDLLYILGGLAAGVFKHPGDAWQLYRTDPTVFYVMARCTSVVFGVLTLPLVYWIGKRIFNEKVGLLAAFFLTFSFLHVQWSQLGYMDVPLTFFISLSFLFAYLACEQGGLRYFLLSGLVGGLSASTKYQGFVTLLWGPAASLIFALRNKTNPLAILFGKKDLLFFSSFVLGFTLGTPFWILDFRWFLHEISWMWVYLKTYGKGQLGYEGNWNWLYYLTGPLKYGLGLPLEITGILGILLLAFRRRLKFFFFLAFPVVYFLMVGLSRLQVPKYILPVFPFLCLAGAFFLVQTISNFIGEKGKRPTLILILSGVLVILPSFLSILCSNYLRSFPDTRELASVWVREHIPSRSKVLQSFYAFLPDFPSGPHVKPFDPTIFDQSLDHHSSLKSLEEDRKEGSEYLVLDEWHQGMVVVEAAREPKHREKVERYKNFLKELKDSATLLTSFSPYREGSPPFDRENVEVASRSLWKMKSTGPTIWIYKLR